MLGFLRKSVGSWLGIGILGLAVSALVFTLFQPTGPGGGSAPQGKALATIGESAVTDVEYQRALDRTMARVREDNPRATVAEFVAQGGGKALFDQLVADKALVQFGAANAMPVSRRMQDGEIASIPSLQVNGKFDQAAYTRLLSQQRISDIELRDSIAVDLTRRQLLQPISLANVVPRGMAEAYAGLLLEVRSGQILPVPAAAMPDPGTPSDAQLKAFHSANAPEYTVPERRAFRYAEIDASALAAKAKPTAAEVRKYYDSNPAEFGGVELRDVRQIVLRDEVAAKAFLAEVRAGTEFAAAAAKRGFAATDIDLGQQSRDALADTVNKDVATAVFALKQGELSAPVRSPLGFHVLQLRRIVAPTPMPFPTVSAGIEKKLTDERLIDLLADTVADAEDRFADGQTLSDVAKRLGLPLQTAPALTADGRLFDAGFNASRVDQPLLPKVFAADQADGPQVAEVTPGSYALFEVTDLVAPVVAPLGSIRSIVAADWLRDTRSKAARAEADAIAAAVSKGKPLVPTNPAIVLPAPQQLTVRRLELTQMAQRGQQVPAPVVLLLNTPPGQARVIAAPNQMGWFVVKVDTAEKGDLGQASELVQAVQQNLLRETGNELVDSFVQAVERNVGVVRNTAELDAVNRRLTGAILP